MTSVMTGGIRSGNGVATTTRVLATGRCRVHAGSMDEDTSKEKIGNADETTSIVELRPKKTDDSESGTNGTSPQEPLTGRARSLANLMRHPKGVCPPGLAQGRPKGTKNTATTLREILDRKRVETPEGRILYREALARIMLQRALRGQHELIKVILDRVDGPVRQEVDVTMERQVKLIRGVDEEAL